MELKWCIGSHIGFDKSLYNTFLASINKGMYAMQFFMGSPQSFQRHKPTEDDIVACQRLLKRFPLRVFSHFPYVANLAGSKDILAWSGNEAQDEKTRMVLIQLQHELSVLSHFGGGVVIHPGTYGGRNQGLQAIAQSINRLEFKEGSCLLLENSAGQGSTLATTLEELKTILDGVSPEKQPFVGVCLDTCHLYAYGQYDLSRKEDIDKLWGDIQNTVGLDKIKLVHLNDSIHPRGCKKDRHERIGEGCIWKEGMDSLIYLLDKCKERDIPIVLETVVDDIDTIVKL